jgi:outer membrane protein TolC
MKKNGELTFRMPGAVPVTFVAILAFGTCAYAQAVQLPVSGRSSQNGSVEATQTPAPGATTSVNSLNPAIQVQGAFLGSAASKIPFSGKLSFPEALHRAIQYNLSAIGMAQEVHQAHGQDRIARSALLPNLSAHASDTFETISLAQGGLSSLKSLGTSIPTVVGPFDFFDLRASLSQKVVDLTALNNYRAAIETSRAVQFSMQDARDLIVLAVGGAYLQVAGAKGRVESATAQLATATDFYNQSVHQRDAGVLAQVDVDRSQVQMLTGQERLLTLQNDFAKQKINLARMIGLPSDGQYDITDVFQFTAAPSIALPEALKQAFDNRSDLKAAEEQVRAAERALSAAHAERLPSLSVSADYGTIGTHPSNSNTTYAAVATLSVPIWTGGSVGGDIEEAQAALTLRTAEFADLKGQIERDVRNAYLDIETATRQVEVAEKSLEVSRESLELTRQRFEAGVTDNQEVLQGLQSVAVAELDYINSQISHHLAKLSLARALGRAAENWPEFLKIR